MNMNKTEKLLAARKRYKNTVDVIRQYFSNLLCKLPSQLLSVDDLPNAVLGSIMKMNMNETEKLLAARKRLKEFQQNKSNPNQENVQKEPRKSVPVQNLHKTVEAPAAQDLNSTHSPDNQNHNIIPTPKESPTSGNGNLIHFTETNTDSAPISNSRPSEEQTEIAGYFNPELKVAEKVPEIEHQTERESVSDTQTEVNEQKNESHPQSIQQSVPLSPASPPPEKSTNYYETLAENGTINDSPSSQKEHLLQMASAVADALHDSNECTVTAPIETDLEYRNQFLSSCLQEQKHMVNQLHVQVSHYSSRVAELEAILATKEVEFEAKLMREVNPLKEQLQVHAQTTGILVGEKAELTAAVEQCQAIAQRKSEEVEELSGRLRNSQARVTELEKELAHVKNTVDDTRKMYQQLHLDYAELDKRYNELRKTKEDDELEVSELRQEISVKNAENLSLQRELEEKNTLLSLNELKIQQLTSSPQEMQALEGQQQAVMVLEQQLSQLREALKSVNQDKEEAAKQYENYVRQLDSRYEKIVKEHEASKKNVEALEDRERSYIQRLSDLEQSLQKEREKVEKLLPLQSHEDQIDHLTKSLDALTLEHSNLQTTLNERDAEIEALKRDLEEMRELNEDTVEKSKLVSALESEQLGASRAVSQNQQLKVQLGEMHDAFVTLSNSKLDLTEQLQAERTIGRKLNGQLNTLETEIDELKERLKQKERIIEEMETEKLQTAQIADQMHHYQAQSNQARTLQQELQNALGCIEILRRENQQLTMDVNVLRLRGPEDQKLSNGDDRSNQVNGEQINSPYSSFKAAGDNAALLPDPLKKLEVRFKETMERVAELTDEKQRLEHLVLQLQGETETIGEYITLYQKQRAILQKKAAEKEETFRLLVDQRNRQQEQLHQLKVLVADLIRKKSVASAPPDDPNSSPVIEFQNEHEIKPLVNEQPEQGQVEKTVIDVNDKTTSKILDLLTEIKDCKDTCILEPNFHPCPWCSGKLITV